MHGLRARLHILNPMATRVLARDGAVAPRSILNLGLFTPTNKTADVRRWLKEEAYATPDAASVSVLRHHAHERGGHGDHGGHDPYDAAHEGHHDHGHAHDVNRHDDHIRAFCFAVDVPIRRGVLEAWLDVVMTLMGEKMLRIKGIVHVEGQPAPMAVHGVQHVFHPPVLLARWPTEDRRSRFVFITRDIEREAIEQTLAPFLAAGSARWGDDA